MNCNVTVDWRFVAALGLAACGIILSSKAEPDAAERISIHAIDACAEHVVVDLSNH